MELEICSPIFNDTKLNSNKVDAIVHTRKKFMNGLIIGNDAVET